MEIEVIIGADHAGFELKSNLIDFLSEKGYDVIDLGTNSEESCNYPEFAKKVAEKVSGSNAKGILVCGTGIGMSIAANKIKGIRAALAYDIETAELSRKHNDSNVLCIGARKVSEKEAKKITETWLKTDFEGGRHQGRLDLIANLERKN